eukprot:EG_transcript_5018
MGRHPRAQDPPGGWSKEAWYHHTLGELDQRLEELHDRLDDPKRAHDTVEDTLLAVDRVLMKFDVPRSVEETLERGKAVDFDQFLQSYDRVTEAKRSIDVFLLKSGGLKPAREAAQRLEKLLQGAERTLESLFCDTVRAGSCVVDPKAPAGADAKAPLVLLHPPTVGPLLCLAGRLQHTAADYLRHFREAQGKVVEESFAACVEVPGDDDSPRDNSAGNYRKGSHSLIAAFLFLLRLAATEHRICKVLLNADPALSDVAQADRLADSALARDLMRSTVRPVVERWVELATALVDQPEGASDLVFVQLDLLEHLATQRATLEALGLEADLRPLARRLRPAALRLMLGFIPGVEANDTRCSPDGVVHQLATSTMHFLLRLYDYYPTVEDLLAEEATLQTGPGLSPLQRYGQQLLAALHANLNRKAAQQFKHQRELQAVFLLNNVHYIHRTLQQSPTLKRQASTEVTRLEGLLRELQQQYFSASWGKAVAVLTEKYGPTIDRKLQKHQGAGKVSTATKELLKEMFAEFFEEFDARYHQQLHFNVPDDQLRATLQQLIRTEILPRYQCVVDKYGGLHFSSHLGKYIKYDAATLGTMIDALFQGKLRKG